MPVPVTTLAPKLLTSARPDDQLSLLLPFEGSQELLTNARPDDQLSLQRIDLAYFATWVDVALI